MSDEHSSHDESTEDDDNGVALLGNSLAIIVPILMIVMLAVTGVAFVGSIEKQEAPKEGGAATAASTSTSPAASAGASKAVAPEGVDQAVFTLGQTTFGTCAACHGLDGKGLKVGPNLMAPSMAGSEIILGDPDKMALVILKGIKKETNDFMGVMAPLGATLNDKQLAAVMTFVRNSFGNSASPVTEEEAKKARERFSELNDPTGISRAKLDEILAAHK